MKILLIGCGNLGKSLLKIWNKNLQNKEIIVVQPSLSAQTLFKEEDRIIFVSDVEKIQKDFIADIVILALKPSNLEEFILKNSNYLDNKIIISMLAGVDISKFNSYFLSPQKIIRMMPNIAMSVGQSVNLAYAKLEALERINLSIMQELFDCSGKIIWLPSEKAVSFLTLISASGPAYFFAFAEILANITINYGIEEKMARELVAQTLLGSAMLSIDNNNFNQLAEAVSSKGGVTEVALNILNPALLIAIDKAIKAAEIKMKELV